jgi:hypothetical protein
MDEIKMSDLNIYVDLEHLDTYENVWFFLVFLNNFRYFVYMVKSSSKQNRKKKKKNPLKIKIYKFE